MYSGEAVETGNVARGLRPHAPSLYPGAVPLDPAARRRQERPSAGRHPRQLPPAARTPAGLQFRPALRLFRRRALRRRRRSRWTRSAARTATTAAACRFDEIDWDAPPASAKTIEQKAPPGKVVLRLEDLKKYYEVSAAALFGGGKTKVVKANESLSLRGARGRDAGHRRRIGLRQVDLRQGADGAGDRDLGQDHALQSGHPGHPDPEALHRDRVRRADGVPEPVRHAEPLDDRRPADHPRAGDLRRGQVRRRAPRRGCWNCSTW